MKTTVDCSITSAPFAPQKSWKGLYATALGQSPSLVLDFERGFYGTEQFSHDPASQISFSRASTKSVLDASGGTVVYGVDEMAFDWSVGRRGLALGPSSGPVAADQASVPLGAWWNPSAGTLVGTYTLVSTNGGYDRILEINEGTSANRISLLHNTGQGRNVFGVYVGGSAQAVLLGTNSEYTPGTTANFAAAFGTGNFGYSSDGRPVMTDGAGSVPTTVDELLLGAAANGSNRATVVLHKIVYFNSRLSNADLIDLS